MEPRVVDVAFPVTAAQIRRDHAYPLFGALCRLFPEFHEARWLGIHGISGRSLGDALIIDRHSALRLRVPVEKVGCVIALAGKSIEIAGARVAIGAPNIALLPPARVLGARVVVIRLTRPPEAEGRLDTEQFQERFRQELSRQLDRIGASGSVAVGPRRVVGVGGQQILGYQVRVSGLDDAASLRLQEVGVGGKRKMGCGLFRPTREDART